MRIIINSDISFGYHHQLKTSYLKGKLPIKYGFYGDVLTPKNVSLEHLKPVSQGGKSTLSNLVLASKKKNNSRGNKPLSETIDLKAMLQYLAQFKDRKFGWLDGNKYIVGIIETVNKLIRG